MEEEAKKPAYSRVSDYRKQAIQAAKDFHYGQDVIDDIKAAKNDDHISFIMKEAREKQMEADFKRGRR